MALQGIPSLSRITEGAELPEHDDAQEQASTRDQLHMREEIRNECRASLLHCATNDRTAMTLRDAMEYYQKGLSEASLQFARTEREKTAVLQRYRDDYIPLFIRQAEAMGNKAIAMINRAGQSKWISPESAARWKERLKGNGSTWLQKKEFIEETLPRYIDNWKKLSEDYKTLESEAKRQGITKKEWKTIPELSSLRSWKKYEEKRHLVDQAWAFLKARDKKQPNNPEGKLTEPDMKELYKKAKEQLQLAVKSGALAQWKVGTWLRRVFDSNASQEEIRKFINGHGPAPLSKLINNWIEVRQQFDQLEKRRKQEGTPGSFHFVHLDIFLEWNYEKRKTYIKEANYRFESVDKERNDFLQIRHELDAEDWESAEHLITKAWASPLGEPERRKLLSLQNFLEKHRTDSSVSQSKEKPNAAAIHAKIENALDLIPHPSIRSRFRKAMKLGYRTLWALCTMNYNWEWCRLPSHKYSSDEIDEKFRKDAKYQTYLNMGEKKTKKANVDLRGDTSKHPAAFIGTESNTPKVWNVDGTTDNDVLVGEIDRNKDNRRVWYQTRVVEKDIPFSDVRYIIHHVQPILKSCMRQLEGMGMHYSDGLLTPASKLQKNSPSSAPHAMAS